MVRGREYLPGGLRVLEPGSVASDPGAPRWRRPGRCAGGVAVLPVRRGPGAGEPRYLDKAVEVTKATQAGRLPPGPGHVLSQPLLESLLPPAPVEH